MQWIELTIRTASEGIDLLCAELTREGFDSLLIDDCGQFDEFLETSQEYWDYVDEELTQKMQGLSQVRLYLESDDAEARIAQLRELLQTLPSLYPACKFGPLTIALENIPEEDWANSWKQNYRPLPVGEKLLVVPEWMSIDDTQGRLPVILDLGLTFGTGEHDSTRMCMQSLEELVKGGERVADLGSGSGILSICALRLGAKSAVGVDIDPVAEHISVENARRNGFEAPQYKARTGNVVEDRELMLELSEGGYDIVCANIVAGVLVQLMPVVPQFLKPNGVFLCSGILCSREEDVRSAIEAVGLQIVDCKHTEQWCCLIAK